MGSNRCHIRVHCAISIDAAEVSLEDVVAIPLMSHRIKLNVPSVHRSQCMSLSVYRMCDVLELANGSAQKRARRRIYPCDGCALCKFA